MTNSEDSNLKPEPASPSASPAQLNAGDQSLVSTTVWIVVLHWQGAHHTRACLSSLQSLNHQDRKILLVDNGSPDQSGEVVAREFPGVEILKLATNLGFAGGCNAGINYCIDRGAEWIWLLNNDTQADPLSLELLMHYAQQNPRAGALGATVYTGSGNHFVASGPGEIDFNRAKTFLREQIPQAETVSCQWISGSNLLLRTSAIQQVGAFDEDYFLYFEDTELCHRLIRNNWECLLVPAAKIKHVGGASTEGSRSVWRAYYYTRNRLLFFRRSLEGLKWLPAMLSIYAHLLRHALVLPYRGTDGKNQLRAEYLGWRDYTQNRLGKATCLDWSGD